ncbi:MAG TPA: hypothetical protein VI322_05225 [Candidatus Saccharimonadia bacterium]
MARNRLNKYDPPQIKARLDAAKADSAENQVNGERFFFQLRNFWGILLAVVLALSIIFQFVTAFGVGFGWLDFQRYQTFLDVIVGGNFIQVIGLCTIVVAFLFLKNSPRKYQAFPHLSPPFSPRFPRVFHRAHICCAGTSVHKLDEIFG